MAASKNPLLRLGHIRDELVWLLPRFNGMTYETFISDMLLVRAVERSILIVSEAAKSLPDDLIERYPAVEWHAVRGIGNVLRHEYERIEAKTLWMVLTKSFPHLLPIIEQMIDDIS